MHMSDTEFNIMYYTLMFWWVFPLVIVGLAAWAFLTRKKK